jgi:hypothetical protein
LLLLSQLALFWKVAPAGCGAVGLRGRATLPDSSASATETAIIEIAAFSEFVLPKLKFGCPDDILQSKDEDGGPISFSAVA